MADEAKQAQEKQAADKKQLEQQHADREKQRVEHEKNRGRPTPTQEEADLLKLGNPVELSPDGSPPDPQQPTPQHKQDQPAAARGGYQTRQAQPAGDHRVGRAHD